MSLSVVLPCFNEAPNIAATIRDVQSWLERVHLEGEIIAVDDGSSDETLAVLRGLQQEVRILRVVRHEVNRGYGAAVRSGCDAAEKEVVAFMDSDGQFHAEDLGLLLAFIPEFAFVTGLRVKRADPFPRSLNSHLYKVLVRFVLGVRVTDVNCGMKMFRRSLWKTIRPEFATGALINAEMFYAMTIEGIPWKELAVPHYPRTAGTQTGANLRVIFRMFRELWILRRSRRALHERRKQAEVSGGEERIS